jgi:hypothetical protein
MAWEWIGAHRLLIIVVGAAIAAIAGIITYEQNIPRDWINADRILALVTALIGIGTAIAGIITYERKKKNELLTQVVMPVLSEYNDLEDADIAVDILNDYPYEFMQTDDPKALHLYSGRISKEDLPLVLRDNRWVDTSPVEDKVVRSFDALLYFFAKLEYVVKLGLLKRSDLTLFKYEIDRVADDEAICNFVNVNKLSFDGELNDKLKMKEDNALNIVGKEDKQLEKLVGAGYRVNQEYRRRVKRPVKKRWRWLKASAGLSNVLT